MNKESGVVTEFGALIDGDMNHFKDFCANKDLGYLMGLLNFIKKTYEDVRIMKQELIDKLKKGDVDKEEGDNCLCGLYSILFKLEDRALYLNSEIKRRTKSGN